MPGLKLQNWFEKRSKLESLIIFVIFILGGISSLTDRYAQKATGIFIATGIIFVLINSGIGFLIVKLFSKKIRPTFIVFNSIVKTKYIIALFLSIFLNLLFLMN